MLPLLLLLAQPTPPIPVPVTPCVPAVDFFLVSRFGEFCAMRWAEQDLPVGVRIKTSTSTFAHEEAFREQALSEAIREVNAIAGRELLFLDQPCRDCPPVGVQVEFPDDIPFPPFMRARAAMLGAKRLGETQFTDLVGGVLRFVRVRSWARLEGEERVRNLVHELIHAIGYGHVPVIDACSLMGEVRLDGCGHPADRTIRQIRAVYGVEF